MERILISITDEKTMKMLCIYIDECCSVGKKNEIKKIADKCMLLEEIYPNMVTQTKKLKCSMFFLK